MTPILLTADRLFDGSGSAARLHPVLHLAGERIVSIDQGPIPPTGASRDRFDFPGCTILPGLIDTHVHLVFSAADTHEAIVDQISRETDEELLARALAN